MIYVNVNSHNLGFPYFDIFGGDPVKKTPFTFFIEIQIQIYIHSLGSPYSPSGVLDLEPGRNPREPKISHFE